jgi:hypothetical protein
MSGPEELYPPVQYGWGWVLVAIGIIVVVLLVAWLVLALTRPRRVPLADPASGGPSTTVVLEVLRQEYLAGIDDVERAYLGGELDARAANLELSRLVRGYVNDHSGLEAPVLTLDDLTARGVHPALVDALRRHYYPSIFRRGPIVDPVAGAAAAREVVAAWH